MRLGFCLVVIVYCCVQKEYVRREGDVAWIALLENLVLLVRRVVLVRIVTRYTSCCRSSAGVLVAIIWGVGTEGVRVTG